MSKLVQFLVQFVFFFFMIFRLHFGAQNASKTGPKLVQKLLFFRFLLFLVPGQSFGGFDESSAPFSGYFPDLGGQKLWFFHGKIALFQDPLFFLLTAPEGPSGRFWSSLGAILA